MSPRLCNLWTRRALPALAALLFTVTPAAAQSPEGQDALRRGEELYKNDRLLDAEKYFKFALDNIADEDRPACYDRLLEIYRRLGRLDRAVAIGKSYEAVLDRADPMNRLRRLQYELGWCYFRLGHFATAGQYLDKAVEASAAPPLPPEKQLEALTYRAEAAAQLGDAARAQKAWARLEEYTRSVLARPTSALPPALYAECMWKLAESYLSRQQFGEAIALLKPLLARNLPPVQRRTTLVLLGRSHAGARDVPAAEAAFREALAVHETISDADRLTAGDLAAHLAELLLTHSRRDAESWRDKAAEAYQAVVKDPRLGRPGQAGAVEAFWKLQHLYQKTWKLQNALQILLEQTETGAGGLLNAQLQAEGGRVALALGALRMAREALRRAVALMEEQTPPNLRELPKAYLILGTAELMTDAGPAAAQPLGEKCLALYRQHRLAEDVVLVDAFNLLGTCAAQEGNYAKAIAQYRQGLAAGERLGAEATGQRCNLLLNVALLHNSQGDAGTALKLCLEALRVYEGFVEPDSLSLAGFRAALVNLYLSQGKLEDAVALTDSILELCQKYKITQGPLIVSARDCRARHALVRGDYRAAEVEWTAVLALQENELQTRLVPRTLNYLGITVERQKRWAEAENYFRRAMELQAKSAGAYPATHFITLWRLAEVVARAGRPAEARRLLAQALDLVDQARFGTYGDAQNRSLFFAQFNPGFDRYIEWCVADGNVTAALAATMRARSRTLLEQLRLAGVDPRDSVEGPERARLLQREAELKRRVSALRARTWGLTLGPADGEADKLTQEFAAARQQYAEVWREIMNASKVYRELSGAEAGGASLAKLRSDLAGAGTQLLDYHIGRDRSYLFVVGKSVSVFELSVPESIARDAATPPPQQAADALRSTRGIALKSLPQPTEPPPGADEARRERRVPLGSETARALVDHYRLQIDDPAFVPVRGLSIRHRAAAQKLRTQRADLLGDVFLPAAVRELIRTEGPQELLVIPDGALHKLPLEALVLDAGKEPRYVLDELPPMTYAPSLAIVRFLLERTRGQRPQIDSLLTVSNPAYPQEKDIGKRGGPVLPLLPFTAIESQKIRSFFDPKRVAALEGPKATEAAVVASVRGAHVVHLAAHGYADDQFGNLFGALALTPGRTQESNDDGFLSLNEIYTLPLQDCELAVLSACVTYVGPQPPLEAGVTLASGFLAAGARRVVASHWHVDDQATAELMEAFFARLTSDARAGRPVPFARALQDGRLRLRQQARTAAPFFWAPFVLIGPPEVAAK